MPGKKVGYVVNTPVFASEEEALEAKGKDQAVKCQLGGMLYAIPEGETEIEDLPEPADGTKQQLAEHAQKQLEQVKVVWR